MNELYSYAASCAEKKRAEGRGVSPNNVIIILLIYEYDGYDG